MIINGRYGSRKKGTYFQIMDDFLNFFKTSLFWSPITGCSLKQRLNVNKYSRSITVNAVAQQNKKDREICHRHGTVVYINACTIKAAHWERLHWIRSVSVLTSRSCRVRSSSRCCSSRAGCRRCATTSDRKPTDSNMILLLPHSGAPTSEENFTSVSYIVISSRVTGVIITTTGIQGSKVLRSIKQQGFYVQIGRKKKSLSQTYILADSSAKSSWSIQTKALCCILKYTRSCLGKVHHLMSLYVSSEGVSGSPKILSEL